REDEAERDQRREGEGGQREQVRARPGPEEPEPDAQEAGQQDEVGEVGEIEDVGAGPADERQLHEEHEEAEQRQAGGPGQGPGGSAAFEHRTTIGTSTERLVSSPHSALGYEPIASVVGA